MADAGLCRLAGSQTEPAVVFGRGLTTLTSMQAYTCREHIHKYNFTNACYGLAAAVVFLVQHTSLGIYGSINSYKSKIGSCPAA